MRLELYCTSRNIRLKLNFVFFVIFKISLFGRPLVARNVQLGNPSLLPISPDTGYFIAFAAWELLVVKCGFNVGSVFEMTSLEPPGRFQKK